MKTKCFTIPTTLAFAAWVFVNTQPVLAVALVTDPAANPALRLESDTGVVQNGFGNVSSWADQSGLNHNATQGVLSAQPTFINSVFNGFPSLRFDGTSDFFSLAGQVLTSQQFSIFVVVTDTSTSGQFREIFSNWTGANSTTSVFLGNTLQNPVRLRFTDNFAGVGSLATPSNPFVLSAYSNSDGVAVYQNESLLASRGSPLTTRNLTTPYAIGRQGTLNPAEFWKGDVGAILVYDRQLTNAERIQTTQYLESKYIPEPSAYLFVGFGCATICASRRRRLSTPRI